MDTSTVDIAAAASLESAEIRAWSDMYEAIPAAHRPVLGADTRLIGGALVLRTARFRPYFNRAIGLGVVAPVTPEAVDAVIEHYREAGIAKFILQALPQCRPPGYEGWLRDRGLRAFDAQERVARGGEPLNGARVSGGRDLVVERVAREARDDWAEFLQGVYRLDTGPWLGVLYDRPDWHQYVAREDGAIVAARGMYVLKGEVAWLGMDGPVPGVMSDDYEPDAALCEAMVRDGLALGARGFIADIELPSDQMATPAYDYFAKLGFRLPYRRTHYAPA